MTADEQEHERRTFVPPDAFDFEDYLYVYGPRLTDDRSDEEAALIWRLLSLDVGHDVLDVACGTGRIANRLAQRGCRVVGVDSSTRFLDRARSDAERLGVPVDYRVGDMRQLGFSARFDRVISWFSSFGYHDDPGSLATLRGMHRSLRPGGLLLVDLLSRDAFVQRLPPGDGGLVQLDDRDDGLVVSRWRLDPGEGRYVADRFCVRDGETRKVTFSIRLPTLTEMRAWLTEAGFASVTAFDELGQSYSAQAQRLIVVARR